ncbi:MAG TPA: hypothetical protein VNU71_13990 [Burkholderiaceae bacterium]|nr:hypothetical protein [Burkholderiaceae bacterium]
MKSTVLLSAFVCSAAALAPGAARAVETVTYKCPGNVYSNTMNAKEAKDKNCTVLANQPVTVIEGIRPRPVPPLAGASGQRVDPVDQRARDSDARRILEGELKREEDRLAEMRAEYNNGQPERQGNEKNYQKYIDRVADMKAAIGRKESDIAALKRELAKVPQ